MKTFCFKLYHSDRNNALMRQINITALVYNHCIALHRRYYRLFGKSLSANRLKLHLTKLKRTKRFAYFAHLGAQAVQDVAERIDRAYNLFFANLKRKVRTSPPKFKAVRRYKSFTLKQWGWNLDEACGRIRLGKKWYGYFQNRRIEGKVKTVTVKRDAVGDIYVKLSRKQKGSRNRERARQDLARAYRKLENQRKDFHFKLARRLCEKYACICLETLNLKGMARLWGRKIHSLGFSDFVKILEYEAVKFGTQIIFVSQFYPSSQMCSVCGYQNPEVKDLKVRVWFCPSCGTHNDRDRNAAINIYMGGASSISGDILRPEQCQRARSGGVEDARIPRIQARGVCHNTLILKH